MVLFILNLKIVFKSYNYTLMMLILFIVFSVNNEDNKIYFYNFFLKENNDLNINLLNGVMLIHPILLYIYYSFIFTIIVVKIQITFKFTIKNVYIIFKKIKYKNMILIFLTFFLGCY